MTNEIRKTLNRHLWRAVTLAALFGFGALLLLPAARASLDTGVTSSALLPFAALVGGTLCAAFWAIHVRRRQIRHRNLANALHSLQQETDPDVILAGLRNLPELDHHPLFGPLIHHHRPAIEAQLERAKEAQTKRRRGEALKDQFAKMRKRALSRIAASRAAHPKLSARDAAVQNLKYVKARRRQLELDVEDILKDASWWQKLNYDYPDYRKMDRDIEKLEADVRYFLASNAAAIKTAESQFDSAKARAEERLATSQARAALAIPEARNVPFDDDALAQHALMLGALSLPVSAWNDVAQANAVFDALRSVNGNYAGLTDFEIWLQCLTMPSESLVGLTALTKGALFESHVADATGGTLHAHFNTPDTDIVVDGVAYQIKATDSVAYIESVDPAIPVIATSEVAEATGAIDGGISNVELDTAASLALGGTVIDVADAGADAVLSGLGGLGILASLRGINHAIDQHRAGMDKAEAIEEGIGVAITGSLKATVDLAEMGYKVATSRPSRFVGRQLKKVVDRIDADPDDEPVTAGRPKQQ
ncbi:hypothetical protein Q4577_07550 [Marinovum sp. 2_MG-2023]|uniref:hypothetical protein n=1 Tax=unclassified Marinovum TaxID=2647166 RepID=UPI0026E26C7C|nr:MULTISPECIES: hypothetical protein [unclassified Marinovum]MDO6729869.1 hypothetical protein [Marinovum sp. 2_MG-2023]MDO6779683.1 hypothetical protein [Marinovum sp. 1_MG-2023]